MAINMDELNKVTVHHILNDRAAIKSAIAACGPVCMDIFKRRCDELNLDLGEIVAEVLDESAIRLRDLTREFYGKIR